MTAPAEQYDAMREFDTACSQLPIATRTKALELAKAVMEEITEETERRVQSALSACVQDAKLATGIKDDALAAVRAAAWTVPDYYDDAETEPRQDAGRTLIHTIGGGFGADWDLDQALDFIERAETVAWSRHMFGHDLIAVADGRRIAFDVKRPEAAS